MNLLDIKDIPSLISEVKLLDFYDHHHGWFYAIQTALLLSFILLALISVRRFRGWLQTRETVIEAIRQVRKQARAHQNKGQDLSYAFPAHQQESVTNILKATESLSSRDLLKRDALTLVEEIRGATAYNHTESLSDQFLTSHSKWRLI